MSVFGGMRPDITPAQIVGTLVAGIPIVANLLRAFGVYDLSPEQQQALQDAMTWGGVLAGLLFVSDAGIRAARNSASARRAAATLTPDVDDARPRAARRARVPSVSQRAEAFVDATPPHAARGDGARP